MRKESPECQEQTQIIYWNDPEFQDDGSVDISKLKKFLLGIVPNNHFRKKIPNIWNSGEEFEVRFLDTEKVGTIIFKCALKITGKKNNHSTECVLCEPKNAIAPNMASRAEEIARLINGPT